MALVFRGVMPEPLDDATITRLRRIPAAVLCDAMNRSRAMDPGLRPLGAAVSFVGVAMTVACMVGDNLTLHHAADLGEAGLAIVADARGAGTVAVWGEILQRVAEARHLTGVVIDGCVRDRDAVARSPVPLWCRGTTPTGPHKGWGGDFHTTVQCGGVPVASGDIVRADPDGIVVVPRARLADVIKRSAELMDRDQEVLSRVAAGESTLSIYGIE